jgi:hypothetical protein
MDNLDKIKKRVIQAAEAALHSQHYVSPLDVLMRMGLLQPVHVQDWKKGKIPHLEGVIQGNLSKISFAMECFRSWALEKGLKPSRTVYLARTRGPQRHLQFSKSGDSMIEQAYQTHYISALLSEKKQEKLKEKLEKPPELVAFFIKKPSPCFQCKEELGKGNIVYVEGEQGLCLTCAGFAGLEYLHRGDASLTRLAKKYSSITLVVVEFSRARKRYERQGLLVQKEALQKAENELEISEERRICP